MRMSEERIQFIAAQVAKEIIDSKQLQYTGSRIVLESEIAKVIIEDLRVEEEIDREVSDMIEKMQKKPPQGSSEWQALFFQKKEEIAKRKNYIF